MWADLIPLAATAIQAGITKDAANKTGALANNLQYQPIDIKALQDQARTNAQTNAQASLNLEKQLTPDLSAARSGAQSLVASDLQNPGALPIDTANQVTRSAMASSNNAGLYGGSGPLTAAQLGLTSLQLHNDRLNRALQLVQSNPLPAAGLDPGSVAGLTVAQNNAQNQFGVAKTGALTNATQSDANANSALVGALGSIGTTLAKKT